MSGEKGVKTLAQRYAPFLAIIAVQLLLLALTTNGSTKTTQVIGANGTASDGLVTGSGDQAVAGGSTEAAGVGAGAGSGVSAGTSTGAVSNRAGGSAGAAPTGGATAAARAAGASASPGAAAGPAQQTDPLGRPLSGDKSKCAPGGLVQNSVEFIPPPCMPAFTGNNGGNTAPGVTGDTINLVMIWPQYPDTTQKALVAAGLAATPDQAQEATDVYAAFVNKHYEMYGRKVKVQNFFSPAATDDSAAQRADAKAVVAKYHPFAVAYYAYGIMPVAMVDQFAQLGVINIGAGALSDGFFKAHAPYSWSLEPQGTRATDMLADYYCKKMQGKNATLAGDPTMRVKPRKLAILTNDNPAYVEVAQRLKTQVSGGMCGSAADSPTIYTYSSNTTEAQNQMPTLVTRMKNDGITTETNIAGWPGSAEMDKQQYYPENILPGLNNYDDDLVGQFFQATQSSPAQMQNTFGLGWYPKASQPSDHEYVKVAHDMNPQYDPPYLTQGIWGNLSMFAKMFQYAGPQLTAQNVERGIRSMPQLGGYVNAKPWNGWKGGNPYAQEWNLTQSNIYTAWADAREIYWSSSGISPSNNSPGTWACVNDCKRYEVGQWPKGEPKQAS
jgi:hypothetical protein